MFHFCSDLLPWAALHFGKMRSVSFLMCRNWIVKAVFRPSVQQGYRKRFWTLALPCLILVGWGITGKSVGCLNGLLSMPMNNFTFQPLSYFQPQASNLWYPCYLLQNHSGAEVRGSYWIVNVKISSRWFRCSSIWGFVSLKVASKTQD